MGIGGSPVVGMLPPGGEDVDATRSYSDASANDANPQFIKRPIGGARAWGGISGRTPVMQKLAYDAYGKGFPTNLEKTDHPGIVEHGRGYLDGSNPPAMKAIFAYTDVARLGASADEATVAKQRVRIWPFVKKLGFQPDVKSASYDPGWDDEPLPREPRITKLWTLRREYGAHAQRFHRIHTLTIPGAMQRQERMRPARMQRLVTRPIVTTYGSTTPSVGGSENA